MFLLFLNSGSTFLALLQYMFFYVHGFLIHHVNHLKTFLHIFVPKPLLQIYLKKFYLLLEDHINR